MMASPFCITPEVTVPQNPRKFRLADSHTERETEIIQVLIRSNFGFQECPSVAGR